MEANKQDLVSTFLEITMCNCRVSALKILEDVEWNIEAAIQLFFEGGSSHGESTVLPSNPFLYLDSTAVPTGWGSDDEDEDEDEDEVDDGQKYFDLDATIQPRCPEDGNEGEEAQEHLYFDSEIIPTGWGSEDEIEVVEFQEHDDNEHGVDGALEYPKFSPLINERFYDDDSELYSFIVMYERYILGYSIFFMKEMFLLESSSGTSDDWKEEEYSETNLSMLHGRPNYLMFHGHFHEAKVESSHLDRWLLVNVQTREQYMLNRETWSNATVQELLRSHFLFWKINDKDTEGQKICYFYKLKTLPAILVVDPITGEKMYACQGMKQPEDLLEDLMRFSDRSPKQNLLASTRRENASASTDQTDIQIYAFSVANEASQPKETSPEPTTKTSYPPLPEEPTVKKHICKVGICLPSGERVQRSFLKTDSTKLLWSFCSTLLKKEEESQSFCFIVPRSPMLFYDTDTSFEEAGLSNILLRLSFSGDNR
ncbi:hypothetical protein IEQ34_007732 [Dendrobium chrysotoxum]|uniref:UBX domain-containing protein n=1 Tax=Dendrobium chrysotoxum TaxID=161865 RepID=A0AAV7H4M7_DENCH|nr:hypothetical protein IEQ34_007732 [Dendrobium chrysotoxum]